MIKDIEINKDVLIRLEPFFTENGRVSFQKIKNSKLFVKNMLYTGLLILTCQYFKYKSVPDDYNFAKLQKKFIYNQDWFLQTLSILWSTVFRENITVLELNDGKLNIKDDSNAIENHLKEIAKSLNYTDDFNYGTFIFEPQYSENRQRWGASFWYLRMFVIYSTNAWVKNSTKEVPILKCMQQFISDGVLLLPCILCFGHYNMDNVKKSVNTTTSVAMGMGNDHVLTAMKSEILLHDLVNVDVDLEYLKIPHDEIISMYLNSFRLIYED